MTAPETEHSDTDRLDPQVSGEVKLTNISVRLVPMRTRQIFRLMRIVTRGSGRFIGSMNLSFTDETQFASQMAALIVWSIPEAEDETIAFLQSMIDTGGDTHEDVLYRERLVKELANPMLEDTVTLIEAIMEQEGKDLAALGKRLVGAFKTMVPLELAKEERTAAQKRSSSSSRSRKS